MKLEDHEIDIVITRESFENCEYIGSEQINNKYKEDLYAYWEGLYENYKDIASVPLTKKDVLDGIYESVCQLYDSIRLDLEKRDEEIEKEEQNDQETK